MTFIMPGQRGERTADATAPVLAALRSIEARLKRERPPASDDLNDVEPALTPEDVVRMRCEGRNAAFEGRALRSCPYAGSSRAKREAWIEGFNTMK
ncbi:Rmf/CrpP family protein [Rhizobium sp. 9140]|uniref:Rmf/CrpP family protein n=1 Tax=Rhizobium sp. 9140 TaxID=1761900 RepID=UPI0007978884|nr:Rmf/CrpP family protein [Rhizobium sp. 9140]CZT34110.1 hypothetical protein GA0004734_00011320 [Rhizobium sp. 9140]